MLHQHMKERESSSSSLLYLREFSNLENMILILNSMRTALQRLEGLNHSMVLTKLVRLITNQHRDQVSCHQLIIIVSWTKVWLIYIQTKILQTKISHLKQLKETMVNIVNKVMHKIRTPQRSLKIGLNSLS